MHDLSSSVVLITIVIFSLLAFHKLRQGRLWRGHLQSNCLIAQRPLVFLSGPRSVFYTKAYWNLLPSFFAEHGFEVYNLELPGNTAQQRHASLKKAAIKLQQTHLFFDPTWTEQFEILVHDGTLSPRSLTQIGKSKERQALKPKAVAIEEIELRPRSWAQQSPHSPYRLGSMALELIYRLLYQAHRFLQPNSPPFSQTAYTLSAADERTLIQRAQELAEFDFQIASQVQTKPRLAEKSLESHL